MRYTWSIDEYVEDGSSLWEWSITDEPGYVIATSDGFPSPVGALVSLLDFSETRKMMVDTSSFSGEAYRAK